MAPARIRRSVFATRGQSIVCEIGAQRAEKGRKLQVLSPRAHHRQTGQAEVAVNVVRVGPRKRSALRFPVQEGADHLIVDDLDRGRRGKGGPQKVQAFDRLIDRAAFRIGGIRNKAVPRRQRAERPRGGAADGDDIELFGFVRARIPRLFHPQDLGEDAPRKRGMRSSALASDRDLLLAHPQPSSRVVPLDRRP